MEFDESKLEAVLSAIPEDLPSQELFPWLRTVFVPFVRRVLPTKRVWMRRLNRRNAVNCSIIVLMLSEVEVLSFMCS